MTQRVDVNTKNETDQAEYLRDILIAAFSHPAVDSVTFWGFWNGRHWLKTSPLFREDWSRKPGLEVYEKLVMGDWWTRETVRTGPDGHARLRGFVGDYTLSATTPDGAAASRTIKLPVTGASAQIRLGPRE